MKLKRFYDGENGSLRINSSEFLVLWGGYPLEEASWEPEENFSNLDQLHQDLESGLILEDKERIYNLSF